MNQLMGDLTLKTMVRSDFDNFREAALAEGITISTVARMLTVLRTALKKAVEERRLSAHHVPHVLKSCPRGTARAAS